GDGATPRELAINLGQRPVRVDLWGHAAPLLNSDHTTGGKVLLSVGTMPIFLVDIDGRQAQLRASVSIDQPLMESSFHPHERRVRFTNFYDRAIAGTLHLHGPDGWTINPPTFSFTLNPGETFDRAFTMQFPYNCVAGKKTLRCEFVLANEKNATFAVPLIMKLGLTDVGMQTIALRDGRDIVVQQVVTNYGDHPINYAAFATYSGQARQERVVTDLAPGATTIRRYRFHNIPHTPNGAARVGLKELQGTRILNDLVEVE
ncbi:MAG TPA: NEW3 domain-containing protein, partial [Bryobacteraceae bacterium]